MNILLSTSSFWRVFTDCVASFEVLLWLSFLIWKLKSHESVWVSTPEVYILKATGFKFSNWLEKPLIYQNWFYCNLYCFIQLWEAKYSFRWDNCVSRLFFGLIKLWTYERIRADVPVGTNTSFIRKMKFVQNVIVR